ncbi:D-alanine--poly(phosphoribitol) ligase [Kitasatospora phosalacinea]|uniref:D-alanine--poly(Phosphoribitol) ligase n=1 Tax=Kitasatospora phosalacinea TaxID=2065 RepID=A0A9W6QJ78_9ACTN|nr:amino acid adenylation domain-containing protein [Kitasatospora phosalacinea]GLW75447.1 D-alanine--poly(phosphoribitol) ligase [Kitasatospora phosalacinea]
MIRPDRRPTDGPGGLERLVRHHALRDPAAPALHHGEETVTYGELDELADRFAAALTARGVGAGDRVLIWAGKSPLTVALMQGALRIGAVYVPAAPSNPAERVLRIAAGCAPVLLVTDETVGRVLPVEPRTEVVEAAELLAEGQGLEVPRTRTAGPDEAAYILYTSGSTGEPKGVCISHGNALAFVTWAAAETGLSSTDRLANHAPFNFDLSVFDLYGAFLVGAAVDLVPTTVSYLPESLTEFLTGRPVTVWYSVPSALLLMMRQGGLLSGERPAHLRVCIFAGEPFPLADVQELRRAWPQVRLFNWYGPTETNVCTSYEVTAADLERTSALPIGLPASGATVRLDPPDAPEGEIVVDGPTVMLGYWGREPQVGPYRTGDLGRLDQAGLLEYVGRRDTMVKVRGHRVELGEIETALAQHAAVAAVAVVVVGSGLEARLHAVVVPGPDKRPGLLELKGHCAARLPRYMIIDTLSLVTDLPRTANGKTDRAALIRTADG